MDPSDFISLAIRLSNSSNEADLRSAVSRAYYGAFHLASRFLADCGVRFAKKDLYAAEVHRKVRYCLSESSNADAIVISGRLRLLRDQRNEADYTLDSTKFKKASNAAAMIRVAQEIVDALQRCRAEPAFTEARDKIRGYARDVLRMSLDDG